MPKSNAELRKEAQDKESEAQQHLDKMGKATDRQEQDREWQLYKQSMRDAAQAWEELAGRAADDASIGYFFEHAGRDWKEGEDLAKAEAAFKKAAAAWVRAAPDLEHQAATFEALAKAKQRAAESYEEISDRSQGDGKESDARAALWYGLADDDERAAARFYDRAASARRSAAEAFGDQERCLEKLDDAHGAAAAHQEKDDETFAANEDARAAAARKKQAGDDAKKSAREKAESGK